MRLATLVLASILGFLATPAWAQQVFGVQGPDLAGTATIDGDEVTLRLTRFSKRSSTEETLEGELVSWSEDSIRWRYTDRVKDARGLASKVFLFWKPDTYRTETVEVAMTRGERGFTGEVRGASQTWTRTPELSELAVLVVPGLSTNLWNQYGVPYLDENLTTLRARGFAARRLGINTEASVATNAAHIAREIRVELAAGRRVLLVAHSKGGADAVTCLADPANQDLLPHVAGLVAIQPVYGGSVVADLIGKHSLIQGTVDHFFERVLPKVNKETDTGDRDAVRDLRSETRRALLRQHPYPASRVPTVVIASSFSGRRIAKPRHVLRKPLLVFQMFLEYFQGTESDGLVALEDQRIPGAVAERVLDDLDHFEPGFRGESPHTPAAITHQGLDLILPYLETPAGTAR